eukprot:TRINITY_DN70728_c0_g1_i1.p1 TRINITY_DN70728_c0_g1~~TRINITY_DN70728_c0_g1_i1.p1  ORF type:complete len:547 (+),score=199.12 TRINITY_DN70728_c0_g1_i1:79-1641(+)
MATRRGQGWALMRQTKGLLLNGSASRPAVRHHSLRDDLFWLLTSPEATSVSDVLVAAPQRGSEEQVLFYAHKPVLAARSPWFSSALEGDGLASREGPDGHVRDLLVLPVVVSATAVQCLLCHLYCGVLGRRQLSDADVADLRTLAGALQLRCLQLAVDELRPCTLLEVQQAQQQQGPAPDERQAYYRRMSLGSAAPLQSGPSPGSSASDETHGLSAAPSSPPTPIGSPFCFGHTPPNLSAVNLDCSTPVSPPLMLNGPPPTDTWAKDTASLGAASRPNPRWSGAHCVLSCDGVEVSICTALLVARSDFHQRVFSGEWSPELGSDGVRRCVIDSDTIDPQALPDLVRFLSTDSLGFIPRTDFDRVYRLAEMADYWMIDHLFQRCQAWLSKFASPETVAPLWNVAHQLRASATCDVCRNIFVSRFAECAECYDFLDLSKELFKAALDSGRIACPTQIVLAAIERWAKHQITRDLDGGDAVDVPQEAINALVFDLLPPNTMFNVEMRRALLGLGSQQKMPGLA